MKLPTLFAKLTGSMKMVTLTGAFALGVAALAPAAGAQQFGIGVQFGGPRYVAPAPAYRVYGPAYGYRYDPGYWQARRAEEWRAREWREHAYREHEAWARRGYYDRGYWR